MVGQNSKNQQVEFSGLILGFSSAALYYLGEAPIEGKEIGNLNLPLAKQNIDIIALLEEKTRGNLAEEERSLIQSILADLRMKYVKACR